MKLIAYEDSAPVGPGNYILDEKGDPTLESDLMAWGEWMEKDLLYGVRVSTVFLGLDHSFGDGPPILYETMIFGGKHDDYQDRYTNRESALAGHCRAVRLVRSDAHVTPGWFTKLLASLMWDRK